MNAARNSKRLLAALMASSIAAVDVHAAVTDIYSQPLATTSTVLAKPNIMFILDDSGSMERDYMPDQLGDNDGAFTGKYGYWSPQCNGVAFDPAKNEYKPPLKADGTSYPDAVFSASLSDGHNGWGAGTVRNSTTTRSFPAASSLPVSLLFRLDSGSSTSYAINDMIVVASKADPSQRMIGKVTAWNSTLNDLTLSISVVQGTGSASNWYVSKTTNLTGSYYYTYGSPGTQAAMGWTYTASGVVTNTFYNECMSDIGSSPGSGKFTKVTITSALEQKYANWHDYYRTRQLTMRTAAGKAFKGMDDKFRVGFSTISDHTAKDGTNNFVDTLDYGATQKAKFYKSLYTAPAGGSTPLRASLAKVGRYFANKAPEQTADPIQYSCQRNFTILSTDGYWNTGSESDDYGPFRLASDVDIGQQDGKEARPMRDSAVPKTTTTTITTTKQREQVVTPTTTTNVYRRYSWTVGASQNCSGNAGRAVKFQEQRRTDSASADVTIVRDATIVTTRTVVETDGVVTSDNTVGPTTSYAPISSGSLPTTSDAGSFVNFGSAVNGCASNQGMTDKGIPNSNGAVAFSETTESDAKCTGSGGCTGFRSTTNGVFLSGPTATPAASTTTLLSGPTTSVTTNAVGSETGGVSTTLADVAQYYYATDLRSAALGNCTSGSSGKDVCANDTLQPSPPLDLATHQHMTTYTIGLGLSGTLAYDENYLNQTSGTYVDLKSGAIKWPNPMPTEGATRIDDLWHAAVNGRGRYFATKNADTLSSALAGALAEAAKATGSAAGAATNSLEPVVGDNNRAYIATYTTVAWTGDILAYPLDATNGSVDTTDKKWSARDRLDALYPNLVVADVPIPNATARKIYYMQPGTKVRRDFTFTNLSADGFGGHFSGLCSKVPAPSQCSTLNATLLAKANSGDNVVNFLRGDRNYEAGKPESLFRSRENLLGDIINASPTYVKKSPLEYADTGHAAFAGTTASRDAMLYAAANDGMLHAFDATTGDEKWAFVPSFVMPNMHKLADTNYKFDHRYFVDGSPVVGDIYTGTAWKTILVGGLNAGGKGYYALDITNPSTPVVMWEFTDANMGFTYGNPVITKRKDGTWVVAVTSGLNNADGKGHMYLIDAATGVRAAELTTGAGDATTPSGLAKINAWTDNSSDNTALRYYGGDMLGNLWRFDFDDLVAPAGPEVTKLALFQHSAASPQPITTKPQLTLVTDGGGTKVPVIVVATGRYLGTSDVSDATVQSIYAVKDSLLATGWGDVRAGADLVTRTVTIASGSLEGKDSGNTVDWRTNAGWRLDLPQSKERVVTDFLLQFNVLTVASAIPGLNECSPSGGTSWIYNINVAKGTAANGTTISQYLGAFLVVGMSSIMDSTGNIRQIVVGSDTSVRTLKPPPGELPGAKVRRSAWRELIN